MNYLTLVQTYEKLEKTAGRLDKVSIISELLKDAETDILPKVALLIQGRVFPSWDERVIGIARQTIIKVICQTTGFPEKDIVEKFNQVGDLGLVVEELVSKKKQ